MVRQLAYFKNIYTYTLHKEQIIQLMHEQWIIVEENFLCFCNTANHEALHNMRVAIKKIKAITWLQDKHRNSDVQKKCMTSIVSIFKHAGKIRNAHLNLTYCMNHPLEYGKLAESQQRIIQTNFKLFVAKQALYIRQIHQSETCLKVNYVPISCKDASLLIENRTQKIIRHFGAAPTLQPTILHAYRKKIKSIIAIHKIFLPHTKHKMLKHTKQWDKLQDTIGAWHDLELFQNQLRSRHLEKKGISDFEMLVQQQLTTAQRLATKLVKIYTGKKMSGKMGSR